MFRQKCVIYINGEEVLITSIDPNTESNTNTILLKKALSLREFISMIKSSDQSISTKYFCQQAIKYEQTSNRIYLYLFSEPCKIDLKARIDGDIKEYKNAAFPGYIMKVEFDLSGRLYGSSIRTVKDCYSAYDIKDNMKTYIMPFPNVYYNSDNICWSSTLSGLEINLKNANLLLNIFNTSVFNYDLFTPALNKINHAIAGVNSLDSYFNYLTTVEEYPQELYFESW
jgi:hypothetical protein